MPRSKACRSANPAIAFTLLFGVHSVAQFLAWANADASGHGQSSGAWRVLAFPTFPVLGRFADVWFWQLMVVNSVLWALLGTAVLAIWLRLRRVQAGDNRTT